MPNHFHLIVAPSHRAGLRQILSSKGLTGNGLNKAVAAISSNEKTWIDFMLTEEYGLAATLRTPRKSAMSGFVFFLIGALKSRWALAAWWRSGTETLTIGMAAAGCAYLVGYLLRGIA